MPLLPFRIIAQRPRLQRANEPWRFCRSTRIVLAGVTLGQFCFPHVSPVGLSGQDVAPGDRVTEEVPGTEVSLTMVFIPGGESTMGSSEGEEGRDPDEGPAHVVTVSPFWMTAHEISHDAFGPYRFRRLDDHLGVAESFDADAVTRPSPPYEDPSHGMDKDDHPVTGMTRYAALEYARWLSEKTGRLFRLPTEAEWEHACRAGDTSAFGRIADPDDLVGVAWSETNASGTYHPVGSLSPNAWGLYDMQGNVAEWVLDEYAEDAYQGHAANPVDPVTGRAGRGRGIVRGGAFDDASVDLRCAARFPETAAWKRRDPQFPKSRWWNTDSPHVGFRLVSPARSYSESEIREYWAELIGSS